MRPYCRCTALHIHHRVDRRSLCRRPLIPSSFHQGLLGLIYWDLLRTVGLEGSPVQGAPKVENRNPAGLPIPRYTKTIEHMVALHVHILGDARFISSAVSARWIQAGLTEKPMADPCYELLGWLRFAGLRII